MASADAAAAAGEAIGWLSVGRLMSALATIITAHGPLLYLTPFRIRYSSTRSDGNTGVGGGSSREGEGGGGEVDGCKQRGGRGGRRGGEGRHSSRQPCLYSACTASAGAARLPGWGRLLDQSNHALVPACLMFSHSIALELYFDESMT